MNGTQTDEGDTQGEEDNNFNENLSELDKLKAHNDEVEKEIIRGRQLKAEGLKQEAEKMLGGKSDAGQVTEAPKEETAKEYSERIMKGGLKE